MIFYVDSFTGFQHFFLLLLLLFNITSHWVSFAEFGDIVKMREKERERDR